MAKKIKVLIAEDVFHERKGFKSALAFFDWIQVVGEATSAQQTVEKARVLQPDVILMDLDFYGSAKASFSAIGTIKVESPQIKFLVVTHYQELIDDAQIGGRSSCPKRNSSRRGIYCVKNQRCL